MKKILILIKKNINTINLVLKSLKIQVNKL